MGSLIVDDRVLAALLQAKGITQICDTSGKTVGFFAPVAIPNATIQARISAPAAPDELRRRKQSGEKGSPMTEVLARLEALEAECARRRAAGEKEMTPEEGVAFVQALRQRP
jgi:hypothetical protein